MNTDHGPELLTGGTDQRVRKWNLTSPSDSYMAIPAASDMIGHSVYCYEYVYILIMTIQDYNFC